MSLIFEELLNHRLKSGCEKLVTGDIGPGSIPQPMVLCVHVLKIAFVEMSVAKD